MSSKNKKARPDEVWHRFLRMFAQTGQWSKEWGNRPSTTNTRGHAALVLVHMLTNSSTHTGGKMKFENENTESFRNLTIKNIIN